DEPRAIGRRRPGALDLHVGRAVVDYELICERCWRERRAQQAERNDNAHRRTHQEPHTARVDPSAWRAGFRRVTGGSRNCDSAQAARAELVGGDSSLTSITAANITRARASYPDIIETGNGRSEEH